jgi:hypothetical protein
VKDALAAVRTHADELVTKALAWRDRLTADKDLYSTTWRGFPISVTASGDVQLQVAFRREGKQHLTVVWIYPYDHYFVFDEEFDLLEAANEQV